ncbi:peptide deformylase [soil metagenome]
MALRELRFLGDPVLRAAAAPVDAVDDEVRRLIADMFDTMYAEEGVGLAAPQVGIGQRIIVVDARDEDVAPFALINPEIVAASEDVDRAEEGCLSIPGLTEVVERSVAVQVRALDGEGRDLVVDAEGLLARILQHEVDHINGILFIDRVSALKRKLLLNRWQKVKP